MNRLNLKLNAMQLVSSQAYTNLQLGQADIRLFDRIFEDKEEKEKFLEERKKKSVTYNKFMDLYFKTVIVTLKKNRQQKSIDLTMFNNEILVSYYKELQDLQKNKALSEELVIDLLKFESYYNATNDLVDEMIASEIVTAEENLAEECVELSDFTVAPLLATLTAGNPFASKFDGTLKELYEQSMNAVISRTLTKVKMNLADNKVNLKDFHALSNNPILVRRLRDSGFQVEYDELVSLSLTNILKSNHTAWELKSILCDENNKNIFSNHPDLEVALYLLYYDRMIYLARKHLRERSIECLACIQDIEAIAKNLPSQHPLRTRINIIYDCLYEQSMDCVLAHVLEVGEKNLENKTIDLEVLNIVSKSAGLIQHAMVRKLFDQIQSLIQKSYTAYLNNVIAPFQTSLASRIRLLRDLLMSNHYQEIFNNTPGLRESAMALYLKQLKRLADSNIEKGTYDLKLFNNLGFSDDLVMDKEFEQLVLRLSAFKNNELADWVDRSLIPDLLERLFGLLLRTTIDIAQRNLVLNIVDFQIFDNIYLSNYFLTFYKSSTENRSRIEFLDTFYQQSIAKAVENRINYSQALYARMTDDELTSGLSAPSDLLSYRLKLLEEGVEVKKGVVYIRRISDFELEYTVINMQGALVTDRIRADELPESCRPYLTEKKFKLDEIKSFEKDIIQITSLKGHTVYRDAYRKFLYDSNQLVLHVQLDILEKSNLPAQLLVMERWVFMLGKFLTQGDFQSFMSVHAAINSIQIKGLNIHDHLSANAQYILQTIDRLLPPNNQQESFANLRYAIDQAVKEKPNAVLVPYLLPYKNKIGGGQEDWLPETTVKEVLVSNKDDENEKSKKKKKHKSKRHDKRNSKEEVASYGKQRGKTSYISLDNLTKMLNDSSYQEPVDESINLTHKFEDAKLLLPKIKETVATGLKLQNANNIFTDDELYDRFIALEKPKTTQAPTPANTFDVNHQLIQAASQFNFSSSSSTSSVSNVNVKTKASKSTRSNATLTPKTFREVRFEETGYIENPTPVGTGCIETPTLVGTGYIENPTAVGTGYIENPTPVGTGYIETSVPAATGYIESSTTSTIEILYAPLTERGEIKDEPEITPAELKARPFSPRLADKIREKTEIYEDFAERLAPQSGRRQKTSSSTTSAMNSPRRRPNINRNGRPLTPRIIQKSEATSSDHAQIASANLSTPTTPHSPNPLASPARSPIKSSPSPKRSPHSPRLTIAKSNTLRSSGSAHSPKGMNYLVRSASREKTPRVSPHDLVDGINSLSLQPGAKDSFSEAQKEMVVRQMGIPADRISDMLNSVYERKKSVAKGKGSHISKKEKNLRHVGRVHQKIINPKLPNTELNNSPSPPARRKFVTLRVGEDSSNERTLRSTKSQSKLTMGLPNSPRFFLTNSTSSTATISIDQTSPRPRALSLDDNQIPTLPSSSSSPKDDKRRSMALSKEVTQSELWTFDQVGKTATSSKKTESPVGERRSFLNLFKKKSSSDSPKGTPKQNRRRSATDSSSDLPKFSGNSPSMKKSQKE